MRVTPVLALALCAAVAAAQPSMPEQIHYAFAGRDASGVSNGAAISWATPVATSTSTVWYGLTPDALTMTASGDSVTYLAVSVHPRAFRCMRGGSVPTSVPMACVGPMRPVLLRSSFPRFSQYFKRSYALRLGVVPRHPGLIRPQRDASVRSRTRTTTLC